MVNKDDQKAAKKLLKAITNTSVPKKTVQGYIEVIYDVGNFSSKKIKNMTYSEIRKTFWKNVNKAFDQYL